MKYNSFTNWRKAVDFTLADAARKLHVSKKTGWNYEHAKTRIPFAVQCVMASFAGCTDEGIDWIHTYCDEAVLDWLDIFAPD